MKQDKDTRQYARAIRETRKKKGWTQKQLAQKIHSTQQAIARWESGATEPRADNLLALAEALGVPLSHFIDRETVDTDETFGALYSSLSLPDKQKTIAYMELLKRQEVERDTFNL